MVPLPLFKLASLFVKHISKYGANSIKAQAHEHPRFRAFAARYGQAIHQLNMRLNVAVLRDPEAERRAREKAEAPTVKTEEQHRRDEAFKAKHGAEPVASQRRRFPFFPSVWRRKFRPLPEAKAVSLFADVIGDAFILSVGGGLIIYEYWKSSKKPDTNKERILELTEKLDVVSRREDQRARDEEDQRRRLESLEEELRLLKEQRVKSRIFPSLMGS
ncbi:Optic atrophy 3 protein (OPA3) [Geosmithia morbida]|uniref:Optic atrophy 3 protein (OPA3) n=1 Tax=Geosmithia morbida TaxID=1094350 RepID=A0A9P4YV29_9HYPO|nr:Optic atrophy 3 protein (OPA3) [Geosmithia morbida]KAF4122590.1 Optic atrophy 3 protein (OPA3) [Geosmithia morbida]